MSAAPLRASIRAHRPSADGSDAGAAATEQDYVLQKTAHGGDSSPAPVPVELEVPAPELAVGTPSPGLELQLNTEALAAWRDHNAADKAGSVHTDRTDYSGLNEGGSAAAGGDSARLAKALEEANQQHQWAMEAVITGWEAEKADLLLKLRDMRESRDTLEAELAHREGSFAGLMEGILDDKLDQMLLLLREHGHRATALASARGTPGSPAAIHAQPTVRKAQQVVQDLQALLEMAQAQQAAVEARVTTMQSAVLQLLPEGQAGGRPLPALPAPAPGPSRLARARAALGRSAAATGRACGAAKGFLADKAPKAARATGGFTAQAVSRPAQFAARRASAANAFLRDRGVRREHAAAAAGAAVGVLATTLLVKRASPPPSRPGARAERLGLRRLCGGRARSGGGGGRGGGDEWAPLGGVREIEVMGPESGPEADGSVEIVLNGVRKRVAPRAGGEEPALVIAWPM